MSGALVQDRIYKGYRRTAEAVGFPYEQYRATFSADVTTEDRSPSDLDPIVSDNRIRTINLAIAADKDFTVPNKYHIPTQYCYADGRLLQQFDLLVGDFGTYFVGDMQPLLPIQTVKCNRVIDIGRGIYSTSGPIGQTVNYYATGLPCFMQFTREDIQRTVANTIGQAVTHWQVFIPLPEGLIHQDDVVFDEENNRYLVDAPDFTSIGYVARLRLARL